MKKTLLLFIFIGNTFAQIIFEDSIVEKIIYVEAKKEYKVTLKNQATDYYSKTDNYLCLKKSLEGKSVKLTIDPLKLHIEDCKVVK